MELHDEAGSAAVNTAPDGVATTRTESTTTETGAIYTLREDTPGHWRVIGRSHASRDY